jgi:hypothetical protein
VAETEEAVKAKVKPEDRALGEALAAYLLIDAIAQYSQRLNQTMELNPTHPQLLVLASAIHSLGRSLKTYDQRTKNWSARAGASSDQGVYDLITQLAHLHLNIAHN